MAASAGVADTVQTFAFFVALDVSDTQFSSHTPLASPRPKALAVPPKLSTGACLEERAVTITGTLNGTQTGSLTVNPIFVNSLSIGTASLVGGTATVTGTVTLNTTAPTGGSVIALSSNNSAASVPATVTVAQGQNSATFNITTSSVAAQATATITATLNGSATGTVTLNPPSVTGFSIANSSVIGGTSTTVTVSLNAAANTLVASTYNDILNFGGTFSNSGTTGSGQFVAAGVPLTRAVLLKVLEHIKIIGHQFTETGVFEIVIQGTPDMQIKLEGTTDFIKWTGITSGQIGADGTLTLQDTGSIIDPTRFYRASASSP